MPSTWQIPVGRERAFLSSMPLPLDLAIGGWQYTAATRYYSGRLLLFGNSYVVDANPTLANPTRNLWFDTSVFHTQDSFTPRSNAHFCRCSSPARARSSPI